MDGVAVGGAGVGGYQLVGAIFIRALCPSIDIWSRFYESAQTSVS